MYYLKHNKKKNPDSYPQSTVDQQGAYQFMFLSVFPLLNNHLSFFF